MKSEWWMKLSIWGLLLNSVGVVVLFFFAMPFEIPDGGVDPITSGEVDTQEVLKEKKYTCYSYVGLGLIITGTAFQMIAEVRRK